MFRPLELFIGLRYTRAKRRNQFISFISSVSIVCIAISVIALITVMSVMNGFDYQLRTRMLGAISHATVSSIGESVQDWPRTLKVAEANPHVLGAAPYVEHEAMLMGRRSRGAMVRGIEPAQEPKVVDIGKHMVEGQLDMLTPGSWNIVLGRELAMTLGVSVGDQVTMAVSEMRATPMGSVPRMRGFHVVGVFELGMQDFDAGLALVNMSDAEKLNGLSGPTGIRLRLDDLFSARTVAIDLESKLGQVYRVQTWMDTNGNLFSALDMEKKVMFVILSLIILVA
ncbi:MAG: ABC transporter permease, partial [Rhodanobacter sp.]